MGFFSRGFNGMLRDLKELRWKSGGILFNDLKSFMFLFNGN